MISSKDRSYYIGASDTQYVVGNWNTKSFDKWYGTKLGIYSGDFQNEAMRAGTAYEHKIIDSLEIKGIVKDKQVITGRLRINLDANTDKTIYEIKTYNEEKEFKVPKKYRDQVYVQMYATRIDEAYIVAYGLSEYDYKNFYNDIDLKRLSFHKVEYDSNFIKNIFLPRFNYLSECLDKGVFPKVVF